MEKTTNYLYRHFDGEGRLLYVGISLSAVTRLAQHKLSSKWFDDIATVTIEKYEDREQAQTAEREAIRKEKPVYNIHHKEDKTAIEILADQSRKQLFQRIVNFNILYSSVAEVSKVLGISKNQLKEDIEAGRLGCIPDGEKKGADRFGREYISKKYKFTGWHLIDYIENVIIKEAIDCGEE